MKEDVTVFDMHGRCGTVFLAYIHYSHYNCIVTQNALRNCYHYKSLAAGKRTRSHKLELFCFIIYTVVILECAIDADKHHESLDYDL